MKPFLKWAGGKSKLLPHILPLLPMKIETYYEPFIGGGAVFFALAKEGRFKRAVISDVNPDLIETYCMVRDHIHNLIPILEEHAKHATDSDYFYAVRGLDTTKLVAVERAARLIFLNKTCFNGLYRVNRDGLFNVPFGRYKNPRVCDADGLRAVSKALQGASILRRDFDQTANLAKRGDAVYFDPPYVPISETASFTSYFAIPFVDDDQKRLARMFRACCDRGVVAVLSNSDCPKTRALYRGCKVRTIEAKRSINSVGNKRGNVKEILVTGLKARG